MSIEIFLKWITGSMFKAGFEAYAAMRRATCPPKVVPKAAGDPFHSS